MAYDPTKDAEFIAWKARLETGQRDFQSKLTAALARLREQTMAQNTNAPTTPPENTSANEAVGDIEAPFQAMPPDLIRGADDIVEAVEQDGKTVIHNVIRDEKVLFSTVSRPLADAFVIGWNAKTLKDANARRTPDTEERDNGGNAEGDATSRDKSTQTVDPKAQTAEGKTKPPPERETREADARAAQRKRGVL